MNKIFCLETEWDQTLHDLKKKSPVLPLLDFLENAIKVDYTFRQVATESDFKYYTLIPQHYSLILFISA